jgi:hypothetical protein
MSAPSGLALKLQLEMAAIRRRWNVELKAAPPLPPAAPIAGPVLIEGIASVPTPDQVGQLIRKSALAWIPSRMPKLLYKHRHDEIAGTITSLRYDDATGHLLLSAKVTDPRAALCQGLSCGLTVNDYEIRGNGPDAIGVIRAGFLEEVSLTDVPAH